MGNLKTYTVSRQAAVSRAPGAAAPRRRRGRKRAFGLAIVTVFGVAAGGALGAALYHYDRDFRSDGFATEKSVPPAFTAAVEAIFDTSAAPETTDDLHVNSVTPTKDRVTEETELVTTESAETKTDSGLSWTAGEAEEEDLPDVVVVSSQKKTASQGANRTKVASLLPMAAMDKTSPNAPKTQDKTETTKSVEAPARVLEFVPQSEPEVKPQTVADAEPQTVTQFEPQAASEQSTDSAAAAAAATAAETAKQEATTEQLQQLLSARAVKEKIVADLNSQAAAAAVDAAHDTEAVSEAATVETDDQLESLGSNHFVALPEPVNSVAEAVAIQNGWTTKAAKGVNLRAKPNNKSTVLGSVPRGSTLLLMDDCDRWCSVVYEGQKGFVHVTYVTRSKRPDTTVEFAESEEEVAALERRMAEEGDNENFAVIKPEAAPKAAAKAAPKAAAKAAPKPATKVDTTGYRQGFATKYVNMRNAPKKNARVMGVVPQDAEFIVEPICKHWCGVVYNGRHGYIYRTYFEYTGKDKG